MIHKDLAIGETLDLVHVWETGARVWWCNCGSKLFSTTAIYVPHRVSSNPAMCVRLPFNTAMHIHCLL